jgi:hypothetical protein
MNGAMLGMKIVSLSSSAFNYFRVLNWLLSTIQTVQRQGEREPQHVYAFFIRHYD